MLRPYIEKIKPQICGEPPLDYGKRGAQSAGMCYYVCVSLTSELLAAERQIIVAALERHKGNVSAVARDLAVAGRTLRTKLKRLGIEVADYRTEPAPKRPRTPSQRERRQREAEKQALQIALTKHAGSIAAASKELGWPHSTMYDRLKRFGIDPNTYRAAPAPGFPGKAQI